MISNIGYKLADNSRLLRRRFDERVRGLGLTAVQARLLLSLEKHPCQNQAFYAERLEVEPITLTRIADRMEESGWLERLPDPQDRRARILHLTDKSREIVDPLRRAVDGLVDDMLVGMDASEQAEFSRLLQIVSDNLEAAGLKEAANG